jgi:hypothetical protein
VTVVIERPIKCAEGLAVRARRVQQDYYAIEMQRPDGTWWEFPLSAARTKEDALRTVRSIARFKPEEDV